jgi:DNA-binding NarL/FixJ family response regulator
VETTSTLVGIVHPEAPLRAGLRWALTESKFDVIDAPSMRELAEVSAGQQPSVLLVDERLFPLGGIADVHIGVIAAVPTVAGLVDVLQRGALGYLARDIDADHLCDAVEDLAKGVGVAPPMLTALLISSGFERRVGPDGTRLATRRQSQIKVLLAEGLSPREIGTLLGISPVTVRRHRSELQARRQRAGLDLSSVA